MFDRFTDRARESLSLARRAAERFGNNYIGTEHILLGILEEGSGSAANALKKCAVDPVEIERYLTGLMSREEGNERLDQIPFTPRAKKVLELTVASARLHGHDFVDTGHLVVGLISEAEGIAAQVLLNFGLTEKKITEACLPYWLDQFLIDPPTPSWFEKLATTVFSKELRELFARPSMPSRFESLTDEAVAVFGTARDDAERMKDDFVGTEHLLTALTASSATVIVKAFEDLGVDRSKLIIQLERRSGQTKSDVERKKSFPLTPRAKAALKAARANATAKGKDCIGAEQLLFGLLADSKNSAYTILIKCGVTPATIAAAKATLDQT